MAGKRPKAPPKTLTGQDRELWKRVTESVTPLDKLPKAETAEPEAAPLEKPRVARPRAVPNKPAPKKSAPPGAGLDRRSAERLRRGKYPIEGRLDLHGLTVERAHRRLDQFIAQALASDKRMVLVITGKGRAGGEGVLRREVPIWLKEGENRDRVLAVQSARPADGGTGALYVLLRRNRAQKT